VRWQSGASCALAGGLGWRCVRGCGCGCGCARASGGGCGCGGGAPGLGRAGGGAPRSRARCRAWAARRPPAATGTPCPARRRPAARPHLLGKGYRLQTVGAAGAGATRPGPNKLSNSQSSAWAGTQACSGGAARAHLQLHLAHEVREGHAQVADLPHAVQLLHDVVHLAAPQPAEPPGRMPVGRARSEKACSGTRLCL